MANEHPFQHLFETLGRAPIAHAESVNRQAYEILSDILSVPLEKSGRCILLRAARAGHGKTHLLSRIQHQMGATHEFIPLHASFGCRIDAGSVIDDTLRCLVRQLPASGGLCVLDLVTRRLFASALQPLVGSGEVPCQDREGALAALRMRPVETFDFHHPNAVTAHWARENFEVLGQRLSQELAQRGGMPVREVAFWVNALFRFAAAPLDHSNRVSLLAETVHQGSGGEMERLEALLGLVSQLMRVVLVADDLEGFSSDETAALRFAAFLGTLRQSVDRLDVILSLNLDIWESAFVPRLSGGLADRLAEVVVELEPLKEAEMSALLDSRVPGLGAKVLERIDVDSSGRHARGLIRAAGMAWLKATAMDANPQPAAIPEVPRPVDRPAVIPGASHEPVSAIYPPPPVPEPVPQLPPTAENGDEDAPAFQFSSEPAPPVETEAAWPTPTFPPPPPVEVEATHGNFSNPEPMFSSSGITAETAGAESWSSPTPSEGGASVAPVIEAGQFSPPVESPFQMANHEQAVVEDAPQVSLPFAKDSPQESYSFNPPPETAVPQAVGLPQVDSPFQAAPPSFGPVESAPPFQPSPESAPAPVFTPAEDAPPPTPADTDRVDDLLRQFRDRYGRGSL